jgi:hypothetical protein
MTELSSIIFAFEKKLEQGVRCSRKKYGIPVAAFQKKVGSKRAIFHKKSG